MGPKGSGGRAVPEYFLIWKSGWMLWLYSSSLVALLRREEALPDAPQCQEADKDQENKNGRFQDSISKGFFLSLKKQKKFFLHFPRRKKVCLSLYMAASWGGEGRPRFGWLTPTDPPPAAVVWHRELQKKVEEEEKDFCTFPHFLPRGMPLPSPPL